MLGIIEQHVSVGVDAEHVRAGGLEREPGKCCKILRGRDHAGGLPHVHREPARTSTTVSVVVVAILVNPTRSVLPCAALARQRS